MLPSDDADAAYTDKAIAALLPLAAALLQRRQPCAECHGDGMCNGCGGHGRMLLQAGYMAACLDCPGDGACPECHGRGWTLDV